MNIDFESYKSNEFSLRRIKLPDGSNYVQILVNSIETNSNQYIVDVILDLLTKQPTLEIRLIFQSSDTALNFISNTEIPGYEMVHGKNAFFTINISDFSRILEKLRPVAKGFKLEPLDMRNIPDDYAELLVNSFAYDFADKKINVDKASKITKTLEEYTEDVDTSTFVIRSRDGIILGAFTLIELPDEMQFHSAAGRPMNELSSVAHKLWIIDYFAIRLAQYLDKPMRFSSSGAIHLYNEIGIMQDQRYGVLAREIKE